MVPRQRRGGDQPRATPWVPRPTNTISALKGRKGAPAPFQGAPESMDSGPGALPRASQRRRFQRRWLL